MQAEDCLFFRKVAFPQGRDPVGSHCWQEKALKPAVRSERCASNMVWTEEEAFGNTKKENRTIFTKVQKEKIVKNIP